MLSIKTPVVHWAVRAVPKGHRRPTTYYLDDEHLRLLSLIKLMLCEHYGIDLKAGGDLPVVAMRGKNAHRFPPDRYLFQYHHQGLLEKDVRACMRFLVHGLVFQTAEGRRAELHEMDMMEACREDEQREPEVNFEIDA